LSKRREILAGARKDRNEVKIKAMPTEWKYLGERPELKKVRT